jgi:hypothetical protein
MADVVVDQKPVEKLPYNPDDIPPAVKARAAAVDALYSQNGSSQAAPVPAEPKPEQLPLELETPVAQAPAVHSTPAPAAPEDESPEDWKRRYLRMQGQFNASQKTIGEMQEQMTQLGNELLQAQRHAVRPQAQPPQPAPPPAYLTEKDVQDYGHDLVDFAQRAAVHAVAPHLQSLEAQNAELQQRLAREARRNLDQAVELAVPNYREIDRDPRWHRWLLGVDVFSGRVRQQLLDEAISAAAAPRVISFFNGFLREEQATGHLEPESYSRQAAAPREPALPLASLAAPGRARPATGGDASVPPDRPVYTRALIKQLYEQHRRGAYLGRETEWARQESDIISAGREGRIR